MTIKPQVITGGLISTAAQVYQRQADLQYGKTLLIFNSPLNHNRLEDVSQDKSRNMHENDDYGLKIESNPSMSADLNHRLAEYLSQIEEATVVAGLDNVAVRLSKQFGKPNNPKFHHSLYSLCCSYIQLVPTQLQWLETAGHELNLSDLLSTYRNLASNYIVSACDELDQRHSIDEVKLEEFLILLQGAYIFARMLEELDDKIESFVGAPLTSINLMEANLLVHEILGDNFSNRLDKVVASLVQQSKISKSVIEADLDRSFIDKARTQQQSLTGAPVENFAAKFELSMLDNLL